MNTTFAEAMLGTLDQLLDEDQRAVIFGSVWLGFSPARLALWQQLTEKHRERVYYPPISEAGVCGAAIGAALNGLRPLVGLGTASFAFQAWAQIVNEAANAYYMSAGQSRVPAVFHLMAGGRDGAGPQHVHAPQSAFWNTPGLEIIVPATPADAAGLLRTAYESDNPTIFMNHLDLLDVAGDVPPGVHRVPFGRAEVKRSGGDVTVVASSIMVHRALAAAEQLAAEGIDVEVVDLRTLVPLDRDAILTSVAKTGRLVVADDGRLSCGVASEIAAIVAEEAFESLKAPIRRVTMPDVPAPASPLLMKQLEPTAEKIAGAVRSLVGTIPI